MPQADVAGRGQWQSAPVASRKAGRPLSVSASLNGRDLLLGQRRTTLTGMAQVPSRSSQVSLKTAFTVCFAVAATAALGIFVYRTRAALTLCACAAMVAIALNHLVHLLQRRRVERSWAIAIVMGSALLLLGGVLVVIIPAALSQGRALVQQLPRLLDEIRQSRAFQTMDEHFGVEQLVRNMVSNGRALSQNGASPVLGAIGGFVAAVAGVSRRW